MICKILCLFVGGRGIGESKYILIPKIKPFMFTNVLFCRNLLCNIKKEHLIQVLISFNKIVRLLYPKGFLTLLNSRIFGTVYSEGDNFFQSHIKQFCMIWVCTKFSFIVFYQSLDFAPIVKDFVFFCMSRR